MFVRIEEIFISYVCEDRRKRLNEQRFEKEMDNL